MSEQAFLNPQSHAIITHVREEYGDELEFLWEKFPRDAIWRHPRNQKWYGLLMAVPKVKIIAEADTDEVVEVLDLRFPKGEALDFAANNPGIYPGYHMNKNNWITVILDGSLPTEQIFELLHQSYLIAAES